MTITTRVLGAALVAGMAALVSVSARPAETRSRQNATAPQPAAAAAREAAYRANNLGVAYLEQYDFAAAAAAFRSALEQDASLGIARLNLGIALFYAGQADAARQEIDKARASLADRPHPDYVLGLIARAGNQTDEALQAFARASRLDPADAGIAINLGQLHLQQRQYPEALEVFQTATKAEPYNATAAYGLATALIRSGSGVEGKTAMERFEKLRGSNYATTFSQNYLEQGRYAEAISSTGAEPELVDARTPEVGFVDATRGALSGPPGAAGAVALADFDADGDLDLAAASGSSLRLYRNDQGRFADITAQAFANAPAGPLTGLVWGDADNDGDPDLLLLRAGGPAIYRQDAARFSEAGPEAGLPRTQAAPRAAAWLDADHDGDLDLVVAGEPGDLRLLRNNGDGRFTDSTTAAAITAKQPVLAAVPTDFDNRRDIDLLVVPVKGPPALFRNLRDGTFRDVAAEVGLSTDGELAAPAIGDVNKDGYPDLFVPQRDRPGIFAMSDGLGRFALSPADPETAGASAAQFLDYDNDGLLDLLVVTPLGPRALRNVGSRWVNVTARAFKGAAAPARQETASLASGDLDGDGDTDLVIGTAAGLSIWRNEGGSGSRSLAVRLVPRVSNRTAVGTKVEVRAGSLRQRLETYAAAPAPAPADLQFGFGSRPGADVARVLWPSGILQAETPAAKGALTGDLKIEELDRKPSSCPYLYTWNGERFEFVTDFLGGGEMGYWMAPGVRNSPDPDEYVRIDGRRLKPRGGRYELRVTNELEEAVFLDRAQLLAVAHPMDIDVHPNEGLRSTRDSFRLFAVQNERPPAEVRDDHGHDVLDAVMRVDRKYPDDFRLERIRGYAARHTLTITLPASSSSRALLLTGWTDYAFSGDNVAAHQLGLRMEPPALEIEGPHGRWQPLLAEIGFPVGRPQTIVIDLTGRIPASAVRVRVATNMRIYWDKIAVAELAVSVRPDVSRLDPTLAELRFRGFSEHATPDGREPYVFAYDQVTADSPWKLLPGRYTREGDVLDLLTAVDDRFVVMRPGDEIALSFDESALPPVPDGWTRTYLLYTDGFSKEMDLNSSSPDQLDPLPYHGMPSYPYDPSAARGPARGDYVERYNTRLVKRSIPPIELAAGTKVK